MMSMKVFAPVFMLVSGVPVILPERSSTSAMSVGVEIISGAAVRASVTFREPSQSILSALITLLEFVIPIRITSFGARPQNNLCAAVPR